MYPGSSVVKLTAKTALKEHYFKSVFAVLIFITCNLCLISVNSIIMIVDSRFLPIINVCLFVIFAGLPLFLGLIRYFWRLLFGMNDNPISVFYYFSSLKKYKKALKYSFCCALKVLVNALILFLPAIFIFFISSDFIYNLFDIPMPLWTGKMQNIYLLLSNAALIILPFTLLKFSAAPILFVSCDDADALEVFHTSNIVTRKNNGEFIILNFTFLGWFFLSLLVFPIVFILPYYFTSYAVHTRFVITEYNMNVNSNANFNGEYYAM